MRSWFAAAALLAALAGNATAQDQPVFEYQVETPAMAREGNPAPSYPQELLQKRVEGEVVIQFVVDTVGKVEMSTVKVLKATNDLFAQAVLRVLPRYEFVPAQAGGKKLRQYVQMPFQFRAP